MQNGKNMCETLVWNVLVFHSHLNRFINIRRQTIPSFRVTGVLVFWCRCVKFWFVWSVRFDYFKLTHFDTFLVAAVGRIIIMARRTRNEKFRFAGWFSRYVLRICIRIIRAFIFFPTTTFYLMFHICFLFFVFSLIATFIRNEDNTIMANK